MSVRFIRPRSSLTSYNTSANAVRDVGGSFPGDRILNNKLCRARVIRPKQKEGSLVCRIWPALNPLKPTELIQGRLNNSDSNAWSEFVVRARTVRFAGIKHPSCQMASFILVSPTADESALADNPYMLFFRNSTIAMKNGRFGTGSGAHKWDSDWNQFLMSGKQGQAIAKPSSCYYAQAHIFVDGANQYTIAKRGFVPLGLHDDDPLMVVQITGGTGHRWFQMLEQPSKKPLGDPERPWMDLRLRDPVGVFSAETGTVTGGHITTFFNPTRDQIQNDRSTWLGQFDDIQEYEAYVDKQYEDKQGRVTMASLDAATTKIILNRAQFWFDDPVTGDKGLLYVPPMEEQCMLIARAFQAEPRLLEYAWADHPEFFTDEVNGVLRSRRSASVPTAGARWSPPDADGDNRTRVTDPTQQAPAAPVPVADEDFETDDEVAPPVLAGKAKPAVAAKPAVVADETDFEAGEATEMVAETGGEEDLEPVAAGGDAAEKPTAAEDVSAFEEDDEAAVAPEPAPAPVSANKAGVPDAAVVDKTRAAMQQAMARAAKRGSSSTKAK